jgi:hypothetical protein
VEVGAHKKSVGLQAFLQNVEKTAFAGVTAAPGQLPRPWTSAD